MTAVSVMPDRIGRFRLRSMLGRGAMGVVYLGHDEDIDRLVAIKLIRADLLDTEERESYLKRFRNEAKIAGRCMHANIVGLYDFAMHDDNPYLVMEYVDGVGLQQFFPRGSKRPVEEVVHIALQVLDALHYAHHRSIVHRDIKPANILLTPDSSLKITDFGISRLTSMELTATPLLIGTPSYMSPEQCVGSTLDGRSDLFSLGCVLYELTAGVRAFSGVNYTETIFSIVNKPHVPLSRLRNDLPIGFSEAIDRALAKNPDDRHANAAAFARTLDEIARSAGLPRTSLPAVIIDGGRSGAAPARSVPSDDLAFTTGSAGSPDLDSAPATVLAPLEEPLRAPPPPRAPDQSAAAPAAIMAAPASAPQVVAYDADEMADPDATLIRPLIFRPAEIPPQPEPEPEPQQEPELRTATAAHPPAPAKPVAPVPEPAATVETVWTAPWPAIPDVDLDPATVPDPAVLPWQEHPLDEAERARVIRCLATVMGPIAPLLVRRAEEPGMNMEALAGQCAGFVRHPREREQFLALVSQEDFSYAAGSGR